MREPAKSYRDKLNPAWKPIVRTAKRDGEFELVGGRLVEVKSSDLREGEGLD